MSQGVPVHLVLGFLGSGKTTLVSRLQAGQPPEESLFTLVNELGDVGADGVLLEQAGSPVRELAGGCICCGLLGQFQGILKDVVREQHPARILVEATGVAESTDLVPLIRSPEMAPWVRLASVITVVDAATYQEKKRFGSMLDNQVQAADLVILNKVDLVARDRVTELLAELARVNPRARVVPATRSEVARDLVVAPQGPAAGELPALDLGGDAALPGSRGADGFVTFYFVEDRPFARQRLEEFLAGLPWEVFRVKGRVLCEEGPCFLNYTYGRPEFSPGDDLGLTRLAFVAWQARPADFLEPLRACLAEE
ncbi:MAG: GTP-binding protein [Deltaproteobacteria bacterium]|nr:GTP-binding protein [Deltaproteobacteria bacterium]